MKYNKSKTYLLPLISEIVSLDIRFIKHIANTYMYNEDPECKDCISILHDFTFKNPEFTAYEHRLVNNALFVKSVDIGNRVLYVFRFPEEYLVEYDLFAGGAYSKFGKDAKDLILRFWSEVYAGNSQATPFLVKTKQILHKDKKLKEKLEKELAVTLGEDQELGEIINPTEETFKQEQFANQD